MGQGQEKRENADVSFLKVKYNFKFLSDTLNSNSMKEEVMTLLIGKKSSIYYSEQKYVSDSLSKLSIENSIETAKAGNGIINIDLKKIAKYYVAHEVYKKDSTLIFNRLDKNYFSFRPAHEIQWKLEDTTMEIAGYLCHKAVGRYTGRLYEAWYSPNINVTDGPYVFKNLPGLVFKVADTKGYNSIILIGLESFDQMIKPISKADNTSREKFRNARKAFVETSAERLKGYIYRELTAEEMKRIKNISKSASNNYLD